LLRVNTVDYSECVVFTKMTLIFYRGKFLQVLQVIMSMNVAFSDSWSTVRYQASSWQETETVYLLLWHRKL